MLNSKYEQMLFHRVTITKSIYSIKYNIAASHLWFSEYLAGDSNEVSKLKEKFNEVEKEFDNLIAFEIKKDKVPHTKQRDSKFILENLYQLKSEFLEFKQETIDLLKSNKVFSEIDDKLYDNRYAKLVQNLKTFDENLSAEHMKVMQEFQDTKNKVNIIIGVLIGLTLIVFYLISRYIQNNVNELRKKDKHIADQYKKAAMGEMIDAIAHQWKTPLSVISGNIMIMEMMAKDDQFDEYFDSSSQQIQHLVNTIDEFRAFFRPNTKVEKVSLKKLVDSTLLLVKDELTKNTIENECILDKDIDVMINLNEFKHVLINIIQNSRDAFNERKVENRKIEFYIYEENDKAVLKICDNAGGIPKNIINDIFIPHFTTKEEGKGTGIGLYLTKQIVEKHNSKIEVQNSGDGVCFIITFNGVNIV
jgi:signal transduction histidine kinase